MSASPFDRPKFITGLSVLAASLALGIYCFWTGYYGSAIGAVFFGGVIGATFALEARSKEEVRAGARRFTPARVALIVFLILAGLVIGYLLPVRAACAQ